MGGVSSLLQPDHDVVVVGHQYINQKEFVKKTGWDGVRAILSHDGDGVVTPQLTLITEGALTSGLLGCALGGCLESKKAYQRFIRMNEATAFESPHLARRLMHDRILLAFGRGGFRFGWRFTVFSGSFLFLTQAIPAYRAKHSMFDWSASTALAGMVYKFQQGPKPMVAGMALGGLLGTVGGVVVHGALALAGLSMDDIYDYKRTQTLRAMQKRHDRFQKRRKRKDETEIVEEKP